ELHYQRMHGTHSIGVNEHYCRRWVSVRSLLQLDRQSRNGATTESVPGAQRSRFHATGDEYFSISLAHPHALDPDMLSCVTVGFLVNDALRAAVKFWDDAALSWETVGDTCERCSIADCKERAAPPTLREREQRRARQLEALGRLAEGAAVENES
ncbi:MAG TPA: hypothetical protein VFJ90_07420, partial [Candidatus Didemnitutus sp.]|nr:hypothetical protein [Candidatus Didemnitutus sp.]